MEQKKIKIDLIVIGNPNSGKTSLIRRFIDGEASFSHFYTPTLGLNLQKKVIKLNDTLVTVCIWDTAGQQKFFSLTKNYFKKADGVLIVFDLTDPLSFQRVSNYWITEVKEKAEEGCSHILIGNKSDLSEERAVKDSLAQQIADKLQIKYFETSARLGSNVNEAIEYLIRSCVERVKESQPDQNLNIEVQVPKKTTQKCFGVGKFFSNMFSSNK